jgi:hypothetical protein
MASKVLIALGILTLWIGLANCEAVAGWDKPFDKGGPLSVDKPVDKGGGLSIDKPVDKGGGLSIDKPLDKGGGLSIDKPLDKGGGLSIDKPLEPIEKGAHDFGNAIQKAFQDAGHAIEKAAHDTGDFIGRVGTEAWKIITFQWVSDLAHKAVEKGKEILDWLLGLAKYWAIWLVIGFIAVVVVGVLIGSGFVGLLRSVFSKRNTDRGLHRPAAHRRIHHSKHPKRA